ncbi:hypothetical protein GSI_04425 [Ganoderma sinense ZZ0214-1]|uniref:Uncharacterized protein n=1 Tax=Ganoderma sinense ZZ0214-1 TaxID=1077348 RepID=A0A2G8SJ72_9APHY|nr:hypothetical protein GSI_04425 [Ganoderma sinense ZZ0214-1]
MSRPKLFTAFRRSFFGPRSLRSQGINIENVKPVYDSGGLPWWARFTYFLVVADLVTVTTMCELSWNRWTKWEELSPQLSDSAPPSSNASFSLATSEPKDPSQVMGHYVLRPRWQRGFFAFTTFTTGIVLGAVLLGGRSRIVRRMFVLPAPQRSNTGRQVVIQSALHTKSQGVVIPLKRTKLVQSPEPTEMMIGLKDGRGHYSLGLEKAEVNGERRTLWEARKLMFTEWYGEKKGQQMFLNSSRVKGA